MSFNDTFAGVNFKKLTALLLIVIFAICSFSCSPSGYFIDGCVIFKGSAIEILVKLYGGNSKKAYDEMVAELTKLDDEISLTNENSKLYYFNEKAGDEKVEISKAAYEIIEKGLLFEKETEKAFSIGAYNLTRLWRLDPKSVAEFNKMDGIPLEFTLPTVKQVKDVLINCDTSVLKLSIENGKYYISKTNKEFKIDLGAIAKGYCADICYSIMKKYEIVSGMANISGNVIVYGKHFDGVDFSPWHTGVDDPRPRFALTGRRYICALAVEKDVSFVTSGDYERYYQHSSGIIPCHIIDPRTGYPVGIVPVTETDENSNSYKTAPENICSATIICSSSATADAYSTAAFVMGLEDAVKFLKNKDGVSYIIFTEKDGNAGRMAISGDLELYDTNTYNGYKQYAVYETGK